LLREARSNTVRLLLDYLVRAEQGYALAALLLA
jgi:hypothetical protein